jgi:hypothetical protein
MQKMLVSLCTGDARSNGSDQMVMGKCLYGSGLNFELPPVRHEYDSRVGIYLRRRVRESTSNRNSIGTEGNAVAELCAP